MIIGRWVEDVSDNTPTGMSRMRLKNRSNLIRGWNRIGGLNIKSDIYSSFVVVISLIAQVGKGEEEDTEGNDNDRGREHQYDKADIGEECCWVEKMNQMI